MDPDSQGGRASVDPRPRDSSEGPVPELCREIVERLPKILAFATPDRKWHRASALRGSLDACAASTRRHAKTFFWCSPILPSHKRAAAFAVYAFCRHVDDFLDTALPGQREPGQALAELTHEFEAIEAGRSRLPFAPAFAEALRQFGIDRSLCLELIRGCCRDEVALRMGSFTELQFYCYQVASVVGLMMSRIFGLQEPAGIRRAVELGIAMQLTNILRDVDADYRMGRVYLPADELGEAGIGERDLASRTVNDAWRRFVATQIQRARLYYRAGELGLVYLDDDGSRLSTKLMSRLYAGILGEIERLDYDVFTSRAHVSRRGKLRLTLLALLR